MLTWTKKPQIFERLDNMNNRSRPYKTSTCSYSLLLILHNFLLQSLHDPFFQPGNIRLRNPQKVRHFFLCFLPSLLPSKPEPQFDNRLLPWRKLGNCFSKKLDFHLVLQPLGDHIIIRSQNIKKWGTMVFGATRDDLVIYVPQSKKAEYEKILRSTNGLDFHAKIVGKKW